jgi:hypothetical protein
MRPGVECCRERLICFRTLIGKVSLPCRASLALFVLLTVLLVPSIREHHGQQPSQTTRSDPPSGGRPEQSLSLARAVPRRSPRTFGQKPGCPHVRSLRREPCRQTSTCPAGTLPAGQMCLLLRCSRLNRFSSGIAHATCGKHRPLKAGEMLAAGAALGLAEEQHFRTPTERRPGPYGCRRSRSRAPV